MLGHFAVRGGLDVDPQCAGDQESFAATAPGLDPMRFQTPEYRPNAAMGKGPGPAAPFRSRCGRGLCGCTSSDIIGPTRSHPHAGGHRLQQLGAEIPRTRLRLALVGVAVLTGAALRFVELRRQPLWVDEVIFARLAMSHHLSLQELPYALLVRLAGRFTTVDEFWLRFFAALFGSLSSAAVYAVSKDRRIGLAQSLNGAVWERAPGAPVFVGQQEWNSKVVCDPTVETGAVLRVWFGGGDVASPTENLRGAIGFAVDETQVRLERVGHAPRRT